MVNIHKGHTLAGHIATTIRRNFSRFVATAKALFGPLESCIRISGSTTGVETLLNCHRASHRELLGQGTVPPRVNEAIVVRPVLVARKIRWSLWILVVVNRQSVSTATDLAIVSWAQSVWFDGGNRGGAPSQRISQRWSCATSLGPVLLPQHSFPHSTPPKAYPAASTASKHFSTVIAPDTDSW